MNGLVAAYPELDLHVIVDNLNTHKPKHDRWLARHPNVHFHYTPTHAWWLNQIECWFSILSRQALPGASFTSVAPLREAIDKFVGAATKRPHSLSGPNGLLSRASSNIGTVT
jgi:transposase